MTPQTWQMITQGVASLGFPIIMSLLLLYIIQTTIKENTTAIRELTTYLKAQTYEKNRSQSKIKPPGGLPPTEST